MQVNGIITRSREKYVLKYVCFDRRIAGNLSYHEKRRSMVVRKVSDTHIIFCVYVLIEGVKS